MQFNKAEKLISELLLSKLPPGLYYHDYFHTMDVLNACAELAKEENINNEKDLLLLKTAALFHDSGFINTYLYHEEEACRMAKEMLPGLNYFEDDIKTICNLIMKTKSSQKPQTHLEKILCDADLDYLGRDDFERIGRKLFKEWIEMGKVNNEKEWNELQIKFLESHHYWTPSAINKREKKKQEHLLQLKNNQLKMQNDSDKPLLSKVLKDVKLFYHLPSEVIDHLSEKMIVSDYPINEPVFKKGDIGDCIYIIVSGNVKLHEQDTDIAQMGVGDFFGEFSLLDNEPRSLSVTCTVPSKLAVLYRNDFYLVMKEHPESTKNIIEALIKRIKDQNNKIFNYLKNREKELEEEVSKKTSDLQANNAALSLALEKIKHTQQQLILKETLASMGQLTAGIAHTLKNPLNFVNNFSLISFELMNDIMNSNNDAEKKELFHQLKLNVEKIHTHGMRANSIVESMLQHTIDGVGVKQPVNIDELADEIITIAYNNYKSSQAGFTCEIIKEYAADLPKININIKEILRALLNLLNNAFYAVHEKKKTENGNYKPTVTINITSHTHFVTIKIKDNGKGVPEAIKERIFEPFFTNKPGGLGNGLGLSMSNELVKMNGGELKLNTEISEGAEFDIIFPE